VIIFLEVSGKCRFELDKIMWIFCTKNYDRQFLDAMQKWFISMFYSHHEFFGTNCCIPWLDISVSHLSVERTNISAYSSFPHNQEFYSQLFASQVWNFIAQNTVLILIKWIHEQKHEEVWWLFSQSAVTLRESCKTQVPWKTIVP